MCGSGCHEAAQSSEQAERGEQEYGRCRLGTVAYDLYSKR